MCLLTSVVTRTPSETLNPVGCLGTCTTRLHQGHRVSKALFGLLRFLPLSLVASGSRGLYALSMPLATRSELMRRRSAATCALTSAWHWGPSGCVCRSFSAATAVRGLYTRS